MIVSRASFGCTFSLTRNEIFVSGGYSSGEVTKKSEKYSIAENKWTMLPDTVEAKCSQSLCVVDNGKYLYAIGGLSKLDNNIQLLTTIERLDLNGGPLSSW